MSHCKRWTLDSGMDTGVYNGLDCRLGILHTRFVHVRFD